MAPESVPQLSGWAIFGQTVRMRRISDGGAKAHTCVSGGGSVHTNVAVVSTHRHPSPHAYMTGAV